MLLFLSEDELRALKDVCRYQKKKNMEIIKVSESNSGYYDVVVACTCAESLFYAGMSVQKRISYKKTIEY